MSMTNDDTIKALRKLMAALTKRMDDSDESAKEMESSYMDGYYNGRADGYSLAADMVQDVLAELLKKEGKP